MRLTQRLKQKPTVSPQLVLANELLQVSSLELEQAIAQELSENPALELRDIERCPACGGEMVSGYCPTCAGAGVDVDESWRDAAATYIDDSNSWGDARQEWDDPLAGLPSSTTLAQHLLRQARLSLPAEDLEVARHLIGTLDDRGFLSCDVSELAAELDVQRDRVDAVLAIVQSLDPPGIAARNARECLLIQLRQIEDDSVERAVAEHLIVDHWDDLGQSSLVNLGQEADVSVDEVRAGLCYIREQLNPFPAHASWDGARVGPSEGRAVCPEPDVIIRKREGSLGGYEIELPKAGSYRLRVSRSYQRALDDLDGTAGSRGSAEWKHWENLCGRARLFVKSIEQRWATLYELMRHLVDYQGDFLTDGERHMRPLTRAEVAKMMDVHESTVSRAVAGKYAELPCGRVVPLDIFFDSAAPLKRAIEEMVSQEETSLSDRAIAERLGEQGYDVARRTVAKYRNALHILPSSLRKRDRELRTPQ